MANGIVAFDGEGICPDWWPRWWGFGPKWPPKPPKGFEKLEQLHLVLAIHGLASQVGDAKLSKAIQGLTTESIRQQADTLGR